MSVSPNIDELNNRIKLLGKKVNTLIKLYNELKSENKDLEIKVRLLINKNKITNDRQLEEHIKSHDHISLTFTLTKNAITGG